MARFKQIDSPQHAGHPVLIRASSRNGDPNYKAEVENGVEESTPFFVDDPPEKGVFQSVAVAVRGVSGPAAKHPSRLTGWAVQRLVKRLGV